MKLLEGLAILHAARPDENFSVHVYYDQTPGGPSTCVNLSSKTVFASARTFAGAVADALAIIEAQGADRAAENLIGEVMAEAG